MFPQALFFDRDGTLIVDGHYLSEPSAVQLITGVRETLHRFAAKGCRLFLFTNQSGVGRGKFPLETVHRCNQRMLELLALPSPGFTEICIATETPEISGGYRKPSPRFILEMMTKYSLAPTAVWMIGDRPDDVQAGLNAGVRAALLTRETAAAFPAAVWQCRDLRDFEARLLKSENA